LGEATDPEDGNLASSIIWEDNGVFLGTGETFSTDILSNGDHTITATVTDSDGNTVSASISITVNPPPDVTAPVVTIVSPTESEFDSTDWIVFTGTAVDDLDGDLSNTITWYDGEDILAVGASFSTQLDPGYHEIKTSAMDQAGNEGTATIYITINEVPLTTLVAVVSVAPDEVTKGDTVVITTTITDGTTYLVYNATVTVQINFESGVEITKVGSTDTSGIAVVSYKINTNKTGTGTAKVTVTVSKSGYEDVTASTTFEVQ
jgi:hypothetical protein